jgi:3-methyladenine DNA glycosylase Tag
MREEGWRPPEWMYRKRRPSSDDAYFENMTRIIFQAGLSWKMIDKKWLNFRKAFKDFSIDKVSRFKTSDMQRLMKNESIVRNRAKIAATIQNAAQFKSISKRFGSFQSYLDRLDQSNNYFAVVKELGNQFQRLGPSSARIFLYTVGEDIKHPEEK